MKKNFKLLGIALATCLVMIACESDNQELLPESVDLKSTNNGMIKSYDNAVVVTWNEALSMAIDNRMPLASEARIYVIVSLAVHDSMVVLVPAAAVSAGALQETCLAEIKGSDFKTRGIQIGKDLTGGRPPGCWHDMSFQTI